MSILGLSKNEIDRRFDEVVAFAEIGEALDAPIQSYSSGMQARLGFACAIHVEPDILLIDEVLAVGDIAFRGKCYRKLSELKNAGVTFILVSHNPTAMMGICESSLYLSKGIVKQLGNTEDVVRRYEDELTFIGHSKLSKGKLILPQKEKNWGITIRSICFLDRSDNILKHLTTSHYACLCIECQSIGDYEEVGVAFSIKDLTRGGEIVLHMTSHFDNKKLSINKGDSVIRIEMNCIGLRSGKYDLKLGIYKMPPPDMFDAVESFTFEVKSPTEFRHTASKNLFYQPRNWKVVNSG
jgi:lipopolysaccharide transport system ATP-binding protein